MKLGLKLNTNPLQLGSKNAISHMLGSKNISHKNNTIYDLVNYFQHQNDKKPVSNLEKR